MSRAAKPPFGLECVRRDGAKGNHGIIDAYVNNIRFM